MQRPDDPSALAFWGEAMAEEEPQRESKFPLVDFQTAIAWQVIGRYLQRPLRVLDAGAGTGRYSLALAAMGHHVTHLDISEAMLRRAMAAAAEQGLDTIEFLRADVRDLSSLGDRAFDLTLCLDAPISYAYPNHARATAEVCRVTGETVIVMVSSRSGVIPFMIDFDLSGEFVPPDYQGPIAPFFLTESILEHGVEAFPEAIRPYLAREGKLTPPDYAFTVEEMTQLLEQQGFEIVELGGPGALARSVRKETLEKIRRDKALFHRFVQLSLAFDFDPHNAGLGAVNLLVVARRAQGRGSRQRKR